MKKALSFVTALVFSLAATAAFAQGEETDAASVASELKALAGGRHVRVSWIQDAGDAACVYSERGTLVLMGYDSEDGKGERKLRPNQARYTKPLITDDGTRVVYGDPDRGGVFVVDWETGEERQIVKSGEFEDVWTDPVDDVEWIYVKEDVKRGDKTVSAIVRRRMDNPEVCELVWDKTNFHHFMLNGDGRAASGGGDGGNSPQGVLFLPNISFNQRAGGCWPAMCPDDSLRSWVFTGNHRSIHFCLTTGASGKGTSYGVRFDRAPGLVIKGNEEMYHPRWSNNPQFLVLSSPFSHWSWTGDAKIPNDVAAGVEVYFGKFTDDFKDIERWVKISHNERGDYWPDAWIEPDGKPAWAAKRSTELLGAREAEVSELPSPVYRWTDGTTDNQLENADGTVTQCSGRFVDGACLAQYGAMDLSAGEFALDDFSAKWKGAAAKDGKGSLSFEFVFTPSLASLDGTGRIFAFGDDAVFTQRGHSLLFSAKGFGDRAATIIPLLEAGKPVHLSASFAPDGAVRVAVDGKLATAQIPKAAAPADWNWKDNRAVFGSSAKANAWPGTIENIAFYGRALTAAEARAAAKAWREHAEGRAPAAKRRIVEARLVGDCPAADPEGIAPYRRCLSVRVFEVQKVIRGEALADNRINVAQWSVADGKVMDSYLAYKPGEVYQLAIEDWESHPEQESERMIMSDDVDIEASYFYQPFPPVLPDADGETWKRDGAAARLSAPYVGDGDRKPALFADASIGKRDTAGNNVILRAGSLEEIAIEGEVRLGGDGTIAGVLAIDGGHGITSTPEIGYAAKDGTKIVAEPIMGVEGFRMDRLGSGYTEAPTAKLSEPELFGGRLPNCKVGFDKDSGALREVQMFDGGDGFTAPPSVEFVGGNGQNASAVALMMLTGARIVSQEGTFTAMPRLGVEGYTADLRAFSQLTTLRYTESQGHCFLRNNGTLDQDGACIVIDWAADGNNTGNRRFENNGRWNMHNGAIIWFASSTGRPNWIPPLVNNGDIDIGEGTIIGLRDFKNYGRARIAGGTFFGMPANPGEDDFSNFAKMRIVPGKGGDARLVRFGGEHPNGCSNRRGHNGDGEKPAELALASGAAFEVFGSNASFDNAANATFSIERDATLVLTSCDNGSTHLFNNRNAFFANSGTLELAGAISVQGNHGGQTGIDNKSLVKISGDGASIVRRPNSSGPGSFYKADANSAEIRNHSGATLAGSGKLAYVNNTGADEGRRLWIKNYGTIAPDKALEFVDADILFQKESAEAAAPVLRISLDGGPLKLSSTVEGNGTLTIADDSQAVLEIVVPNGAKFAKPVRVVQAAKVVGKFAAVKLVGATGNCEAVYSDDAIDIAF